MAIVTTLAELAEQEQIFEGVVSWMYLDSVGNVTAGVGCMLPDVTSAGMLRFRLPNGLLAHPRDIAMDWQRVKSMTPGMEAGEYRCATSLTLSDASILQKLEATLDGMDEQMRRMYLGYAMWPPAAQMGALDMAFNLGTERLHDTYLAWDAAVESVPPNWNEAARQCGRDVQCKSFEARNQWTRLQFLAAAKSQG